MDIRVIGRNAITAKSSGTKQDFLSLVMMLLEYAGNTAATLINIASFLPKEDVIKETLKVTNIAKDYFRYYERLSRW